MRDALVTNVQPTKQLKKRRNPNACDLCRKKKIKCDSALMPDNRCSECVSYDCECVHSGMKIQRKNGSQMTPTTKTTSLPGLDFGSAPFSSRETPEEHSTFHPLVAAAISLLPSELSSIAKGALSRISSHIATIEQQLADLRASAATNSSIFVQSHDSSLALPTSSPSDQDHTSGEEEEQENEDSLQLAEQLADLNITPFGAGHKGKHFGPSSIMSFVGMAFKVILDSTDDKSVIESFRGIRRPFFWSPLPWEAELHEDMPLHEFPPMSLMTNLLAHYFNEVNTVVPVLHRPTFMRAIQENRHILDPQFGEVVLVACALGSRWSDDPRVLLEGDDRGYSAGWRWFRQIRLSGKMSLKTPSLYELQSNILSVVYLGGTSQPEIAWRLIGLGIRFAIEAGAHRKLALPTAESELWKRAFWSLWCYEGLFSSFLGRPRATMSEEFDVDLPIECDDEFWESEDPQQTFKQPPNRPSKLSGFILFIKLIQILEHAQAKLFSIKAQKALISGKLNGQDVVAQLDSELNQWLDSVPDHLLWKYYQSFDENTANSLQPPTSLFFRQSAFLQCTYHHVRILSHRPFIFFSKPDSPMFASSWAVCTTGARASTKILDVWPPFMIRHFCLVSNAVITILEKWKLGKSSNAHGPNYAREHVLGCLNIAKRYENRWFSAGKMADVISELLYLDDFVSQSSNSPSPSSPQPHEQTPTMVRPEDIFAMATRSFPTFDLDFLGRNIARSDDELSMIF